MYKVDTCRDQKRVPDPQELCHLLTFLGIRQVQGAHTYMEAKKKKKTKPAENKGQPKLNKIKNDFFELAYKIKIKHINDIIYAKI